MRIVIAGASGFVGHAVVAALQVQGHDVRRLVRRAAVAADEVTWDPQSGQLASAALEGVDAVINLAGENIAGGRWTETRRHAIVRSRINATATLIAGMRQLRTPPPVLVNASAVGCYGDRGDEVLVETSACGRGFLAEVVQAWEAEALRASEMGVRVTLLRLGVVLAADGGAVGQMRPLFRLGLGGRLGSGEQWMSWVHRDDVVGVIQHALANPGYAGTINVVAPEPIRNRDFTTALARALGRPARLPVPAWALQAVLGQMADEALLASLRVQPARLRELDYRFVRPTLAEALRDA